MNDSATAKFCRTAGPVLAAAIRTLKQHAQEHPDAIRNALSEGSAALERGSFNNHQPADPAVWQIMSVSIRRAFDFDRERHYALIMLTREIGMLYFDELEARHAPELLRCCS